MNNSETWVQSLYNVLERKRSSIIELLSTIETHNTALDEYSRCITYLSTICTSQQDFIPKNPIGSAAAYLPLNLPLYSYLLFPFTLSLACKTVFYRPPKQLWSLHTDLFSILGNSTPSIHLCACSRKQFMDTHVSGVDVVVYAGRFENVQKIKEEIKDDALLVFNGSALNPIVITETANIQKSVECAIQARLYNSGQDCMAPAAIFVQKQVVSEFCCALQKQLDSMFFSNGIWSRGRIGQMLSEKCYDEDISYLSENQAFVTYGGQLLGDRYISPTIFYFSKYTKGPQSILYAPFFSIYEYTNVEEIFEYLNTEYAQRYKGYISIFGTKTTAMTQRFSAMGLITLIDCTLFDYENGNREFGGYGVGCSFIASGDSIITRPILLLKEIWKWRKNDARIC